MSIYDNGVESKPCTNFLFKTVRVLSDEIILDNKLTKFDDFLYGINSDLSPIDLCEKLQDLLNSSVVLFEIKDSILYC